MSKLIDQEREAFEKEFKVPNGTHFSDGRYQYADHEIIYCIKHAEQWKAWQARASVQPAGGAMPEFIRLTPSMREAGERAEASARNDGCCSVPVLQQVWFEAAAQQWINEREEIAAAPHPVSGEQKAPSVQITGHLDEVDAPVWPFINAEARKLGPATGSIDTYNFTRPDGAQPNGVVAVLWNGMSIHALALTVRDNLNRTQCVRLLATPPAAQDVAGLVEALEHYAGCGKSGNVARVALAAHRAQKGEQPS